MDKIIFLDIDGVVNTLQISTQPFNNKRDINRDGFYFDLCDITDNRVSNIQAIMWLNKLCKETGAKIVISSTWRRFEREEHTVEKCLRNSGLLPEIEIIGYTPYLPSECRGAEIKKWLDEFCSGDDIPFIILDDDKDMAELMPKLIHCHNTRGFGELEYRQALNILNNS